MPFPVRDYIATLPVMPIIDGDRAFVGWSATFDCAAGEHDRWVTHFNEGFARWLGPLRTQLGESHSEAAANVDAEQTRNHDPLAQRR